MNWRRMLAVILACVLMMTVPVISHAEDGSAPGVMPRYTYTRRIESGLQISGSGVAICNGGVAVYDANSTISFKITLYYKNGNSWERVTSWYASSTGESRLVIEKTYQLTELGRYKVLLTGTVTGVDGGSEWLSLESDVMHY